METTPNTSPFKTLPSIPADAQKDIWNWQGFVANYNSNLNKVQTALDMTVLPPALINGFLIPMSDFTELFEMEKKNIKNVRGYIGLDTLTNTVRMYFLGIDARENDMVPEILRKSGSSFEAGPIFDVTRPCPPTCDFSSPMLLANAPIEK